MTNLDKQILSFSDWEKPYDFFKSVAAKLDEEDLKTFEEICNKTSDTNYWREADIVLACKAAHTFIRNNYKLDDSAIGPIVRAISFQWK